MVNKDDYVLTTKTRSVWLSHLGLSCARPPSRTPCYVDCRPT